MVDGFESYEKVCQKQAIKRLGCWAHARRKFIEARRATGKNKSSKAEYALKLIGKLYTLEKALKQTNPDERHRQRQQKAKPVLNKLHRWLQQTLPGVAPKTAGQSMHNGVRS